MFKCFALTSRKAVQMFCVSFPGIEIEEHNSVTWIHVIRGKSYRSMDSKAFSVVLRLCSDVDRLESMNNSHSYSYFFIGCQSSVGQEADHRSFGKSSRKKRKDCPMKTRQSFSTPPNTRYIFRWLKWNKQWNTSKLEEFRYHQRVLFQICSTCHLEQFTWLTPLTPGKHPTVLANCKNRWPPNPVFSWILTSFIKFYRTLNDLREDEDSNSIFNCLFREAKPLQEMEFLTDVFWQ